MQDKGNIFIIHVKFVLNEEEIHLSFDVTCITSTSDYVHTNLFAGG